jgi:hypothetical protein
MKRILAAAAASAVCALAVPATVYATGSSQKTIAAQLLSDSSRDDANGFDRNWYDYDIVTQAVLLYPDLVEAASNPDAELTGFLPNDRAFQSLVKDLTGDRIRTEADVFAAVAGLGLPTVKTVLTYHLVGSKISAWSALKANGAELTTLQGGTIGVRVPFKWFPFVSLQDKDPNDRDPFVVQFNYGGRLANGYLHGISQVLRPLDL